MELLLAIDWNVFDRVYMGEKLSSYIWFGAIVLLTILLKRPMAALLSRISSNIAARYSYLQHKQTIRDMLFKPMERLLQTILYFIAVNQLEGLLDDVHLDRIFGKKKAVTGTDVVNHLFLFVFIVFLGQVISRFIDFIYYLRIGRAQAEKNYSRLQLLPLIKEMAKLVLLIICTFWILGSVFHVNIPALIAGLGIGGVAIALAGKETLENFFAAFTILSDKPFAAGDVIRVGEIEGVVERIGFRSTRLRNADGSAYIIPNQNLVSQSVINLSTRDTRGMKVVANIKYGISHEALVALIARLKERLKNTPPVKDPIDITLETMDKRDLPAADLLSPAPPPARGHEAAGS